jgi:hypothetical protein
MGPTNGTVISMSVFARTPLDSEPSYRLFQVAIYANGPDNQPGALLGRSGSGTLSGNAWSTVAPVRTPTGAPVILQANTRYWLAYNTNGRKLEVNNIAVRDAPGARSAWSQNAMPFGTWPATFSPKSQPDEEFSIYATYAVN